MCVHATWEHKQRALHAFCPFAHVHICELEPCCVCVCPRRQHGSPTLLCKPTYTEYSSAGSGHLYLIVCWVIYSEPVMESDVYRHCTALSSSMGTHAPHALLLFLLNHLLFTHDSCRVKLSQNILARELHRVRSWGYRRGQTDGGVNKRKDPAVEKEQIRSLVIVQYCISVTVTLSLSLHAISLLFSLTSQFFCFSFKLQDTKKNN